MWHFHPGHHCCRPLKRQSQEAFGQNLPKSPEEKKRVLPPLWPRAEQGAGDQGNSRDGWKLQVSVPGDGKFERWRVGFLVGFFSLDPRYYLHLHCSHTKAPPPAGCLVTPLGVMNGTATLIIHIMEITSLKYPQLIELYQLHYLFFYYFTLT